MEILYQKTKPSILNLLDIFLYGKSVSTPAYIKQLNTFYIYQNLSSIITSSNLLNRCYNVYIMIERIKAVTFKTKTISTVTNWQATAAA